jgi:hypothetical protein
MGCTVVRQKSEKITRSRPGWGEQRGVGRAEGGGESRRGWGEEKGVGRATEYWVVGGTCDDNIAAANSGVDMTRFEEADKLFTC